MSDLFGNHIVGGLSDHVKGILQNFLVDIKDKSAIL